jgi:rhamnosyltransferase
MVSIVILTLNSGRYIKGLLEQLLVQSIKPGEVIVIDSSSTDNTAALAESMGAKVIGIVREDFDHGGTRNMAVRQAKGEIIIFLTQDVSIADRYALERLISPFGEDERLGAAYGRQLPYPDATIFSEHLRLFNYQKQSYVNSPEDRARGIKGPFLSNSFAAYRKKALQDIGLFKGNLISTEDTYAGAKMLMAGYKLAYVADAMVYHSHNYTVLQEFRRYFDIGVFHKTENWIEKEFGKAEGEGLKYLKSAALFLIKKGKYHLFPAFFIRNGLKYWGYSLGKHYEKIPKGIIMRISMHKSWWNKSLDRGLV